MISPLPPDLLKSEGAEGLTNTMRQIVVAVLDELGMLRTATDNILIGAAEVDHTQNKNSNISSELRSKLI